MRYGVREICDVVFKAKSSVTIGGITYPAGAPVLYIDSAKTSTLEGAATTVYATGGKGNARLLTWEGEKTLTFTVEDALLSSVSFAMLSGAGLLKNDKTEVKVHKTETNNIQGNTLTLAYTAATGCPIYIIPTSADGDFKTEEPVMRTGDGTNTVDVSGTTLAEGTSVFVDYYTSKTGGVSELQIDAATFGGYYYVEASTLFTRQADGVDAPVEITIPKVKIQSNFTFTMASTGDPSTFTFTMDAMPDYTFFDRKKKVLCAMQIIEDATLKEEVQNSVFDGQYKTTDDEVEELTTYTVVVKNSKGALADGALVIAKKDNKVFAADVTNSDGIATFAGAADDYTVDVTFDNESGTGTLTNKNFTTTVTTAA